MMQTGDVFVGVDMGKTAHYAQVLDPDGGPAFDRPVPNDEASIRRLIGDAAGLGPVVLVIDQPSSTAQLLLAVAGEAGVAVAYVTGLQMRRAADLYAGAAKKNPPGAWGFADYARPKTRGGGSVLRGGGESAGPAGVGCARLHPP